MRSRRTLLVEGRTDRAITLRVLLELAKTGALNASKIVVDSSDQISSSDPALKGRGAREKVEVIHELASLSTIELLALVDREFREFDISYPTIGDKSPFHIVQNKSIFWTRGHSIENYFFLDTLFADCIRHHCSDTVDPALADLVVQSWTDLLCGAVGISFGLLKHSAITKMNGFPSVALWLFSATAGLTLDFGAIEAAALHRGLAPNDAAAIAQSCLDWMTAAQSLPDAILRWSAHGHLGIQTLWAGVGRLALSLGTDPVTADQIASGMKDEKRRVASDLWAASTTAGADEFPATLWAACSKP